MRTQAKMLATLGLSCLLPLASNAGTITFFDLTDTVTVLDTTGRSNLPAICPAPEVCFGTLTAPNGAVAATIDVTGLNILEPPGSPNAGLVSDVLFLSPLPTQPPTIQVSFSSDTEGLILDPIPGGRIFEDGTIQTASTITWLNANGSINTINTIRFQSDLEAPEPSSFLMLPTLFAALGIWKHRHK
jgi:hypothetical protein